MLRDRRVSWPGCLLCELDSSLYSYALSIFPMWTSASGESSHPQVLSHQLAGSKGSGIWKVSLAWKYIIDGASKNTSHILERSLIEFANSGQCSIMGRKIFLCPSRFFWSGLRIKLT